MHKFYQLAVIAAGIGFILSCSATRKPQTTEKQPVMENLPSSPSVADSKDRLLEDLMGRYPQYFSYILQHRKDWNVQVIYTRIDRKAGQQPVLEQHSFNVDKDAYFYPASTVKLPVCLLAMQKLNELKDKGIDRNTTMITQAGNSIQTPVFNDPTSIDGRPTIAQYARKILMVSDNDAYNRLYEFLGQEYINKALQSKGYTDAQVLHRLNIFLTEEENRRTNPVQFLDSTGQLLYAQPMQVNKVKYATRKDMMGNGYYSSGKLINGPMDFSKKNRIGLQDLHDILTSLVYPAAVPAAKRFNMREDDRLFLLKYMSQYPTESTYPPYSDEPAEYWPAYCKFLLFGGKKGKLPEGIRSFSKSGDAYGQMLETAYFMEPATGVEFFLSAVIYCNSDGILNDDKYDYDTIGLPFMQHLGEIVYDMEKKRGRKYKPDFSQLMFKYDR